ncbi:excalibur calcium-binding domain-containing protein [Amycolatopsis sp. NPDC098790]|uniref:excalibur calcium-binding domain-containing protein n=1 Tax=Amycolatopsis sp. NPDC098790 TaxID=3363939 RepID=UPI0037FCA9CE
MLDAATFEVAGSDGSHQTAHVQGVATTGAAADCFGPESIAWAGTELTGSFVRLSTDGATVVLSDGQDYAAVAVANGYLKSANSVLTTAETAARQAAKGFWGPPCNGSARLVAPVVPVAPQPSSAAPAPAPTTKAAPKPPPVRTTAQDPPAPEPDKSVYYSSCAQAKAAHATPLYAGQPGYRSGLDRDHDGVACED